MSGVSIKRHIMDYIIPVLQIIFEVLGIIVFITYYNMKNTQGMFIGILMVFISNLWFALMKFENRMSYTLFLASFFCFMLGRMAMDLLSDGSVIFYFEIDIVMHMLMAICLSLVFLQVGVSIGEFCSVNSNWKYKKGKVDNRDVEFSERLQLYSKILFLISSFFAILTNVEQIIFIQKYSYINLNKEFISHIPRLFSILGNMYLTIFMVFLATCPPKRKCIFPIFVFSLVSITVLFTGNRGIFICNFAVLIVYIFWRQYIENEVWISKKWIVVGIVCVPILIAGMSFFVYIREGIDVGEISLSAQIGRFFRACGNTVDLLGYGKIYQEQFPKSFYSFGELIDYVKYNPFSQVLFNTEKPSPHTKEYVMTMHSYAHTISYLIFPREYLLGHGKGSAYIAEVYHDFGYLGVGICNLLYGIFLAGIYKLKNCSPFVIASVFIALRILFYVPRGPMISPISYVLNITTIFAMIFLWLLAKYQPFFKGKIKGK